jgi:hypothetical protein
MRLQSGPPRSLLVLSDLAPFAAAVAEGGQFGVGLYAVIQAGRAKAMATWPALLEDLADLDGAGIRQLAEQTPALVELVGRAWEEARRTADEESGGCWPAVVASALRGADDVEPR